MSAAVAAAAEDQEEGEEGRGGGVNNSLLPMLLGTTLGAVAIVSFFLLGTPFSTASSSVFPSYLSYSRLITVTQRSVAQWLSRLATDASDSPSHEKAPHLWMNLGLWEEKEEGNVSNTEEGKKQIDFRAACEGLARALGKSASLSAGDRVLTCGCGYGAELDFFMDQFQLDSITGIDPNPDAALYFNRNNTKEGGKLESKELITTEEGRVKQKELLTMPVEEMGTYFPSCAFDKILALDSAYHFAHKEQWFRDSARLLQPCGILAFTELCLKEEIGSLTGRGEVKSSPPSPPFWLYPLLWAMNVCTSTLLTSSHLRETLSQDGTWDTTTVTSLGSSVLEQWPFPISLVTVYIDYVLVVAKKKKES